MAVNIVKKRIGGVGPPHKETHCPFRLEIAIMPEGNSSRMLEPCLPFAVFHRGESFLEASGAATQSRLRPGTADSMPGIPAWP
jgi:hypothetical protein